MRVTFQGRDTIKVARAIEQPSQDIVKNTISLWQADFDTAIRCGGELTRAALSAMNIIGDKKYVLVDTKVHMLMPGQCPAIPGWHTDGVPRMVFGNGKPVSFSPLGQGPPDLKKQVEWDAIGDRPRFHLLVTGTGCLTDFLSRPIAMSLTVPSLPSKRHDIYKIISHKLRTHDYERESYTDESTIWEMPSCTAIEWGWWHLHTAKLATKREWRFLIRVTESDYHEPQPVSNLANIIRTQQMVYSPLEFGW